ncbi:hypothetical protein F5880DRAFT_1629781, partial [Lentinula raphanica]
AKDAHVGVVKTYSAPAAPKTPTVPSEVASELAAYDTSEPVSTSQPAPPSLGGKEAISGAN